MSMHTNLAVTLALLGSVAIQAQTPVQGSETPAPAPQAQTPAPAAQPAKTGQPAAQAKPAPRRVLKPPAYVRRFSLGAALTVEGLTAIKPRSTNPITTTPPVDTLYTTTNTSRRVGYGITAQLALTERFALTAGLFTHQIGYKMNTDRVEGTDNPATTDVDERTRTIINEDTRARVVDLPVLIRYYAKDRHEPGPRAFFELGGVVRRTGDVSTYSDSTVNADKTVCCSFTPAPVYSRTSKGVVAGFGVQVNDPIGIRVVPEVRYTRWFNEPFHVGSTITRRDQIEAMISLTF